MKTKNLVMIGLLAMSLFALTGCYTQMAKPDPGEDEAVAAQSDQVEGEEQAQEEAYATPHETNVYVYGGYGYPYYYDPFWSPYYPYRSGVYVHIGYGGYYRDPWDWCGSPWYYDWNCGYYGGYYGRYSWLPVYGGYYYPRYYGRYYDDDLRYPVKQRGYGRRGRSADDAPLVVGSGTKNSRPSLSKTRPVVYTNDGSGTSVRRTRRGSSTENPTSGRDAAAPVKPSSSGDRRVSKGSGSESGGTTYTGPPKQSSSGNSGNSGNSGGTRVRKQGPPASSGGSSTPPQKRSSGGSATKQSGSSGNSGSGTQSSGSSGSSGGSRRTKKP